MGLKANNLATAKQVKFILDSTNTTEEEARQLTSQEAQEYINEICDQVDDRPD